MIFYKLLWGVFSFILYFIAINREEGDAKLDGIPSVAILTFFFFFEVLALIFVGNGSVTGNEGRILGMLIVPPMLFIGRIIKSFKKNRK